MASLTSAQTAQVASWIAAGATLSQVQTRLAAELGVTMTFMDVRFLVDDLNLTLIEKEEPKKPAEPAAEATAPAEDPAAAAPAAGGAVTVEVDTIRPTGTSTTKVARA
jgi:transposase